MSRGIVFASGNRNKFTELSRALASTGLDLLFGPDIISEGLQIDVDEDAPSYAGNSMKKALAWAKALGLPALADDSGLEVRSLGWGPGVLSARVAPDDRGRIAWLLEKMEGMTDRSARFAAALALCDAGGGVWVLAEGFCHGSIAEDVSGGSGFGYDPLFIPTGYRESFASLGPEVKSRISHRALAAEGLSRMLENRCMVEYIFASWKESSGRCSG